MCLTDNGIVLLFISACPKVSACIQLTLIVKIPRSSDLFWQFTLIVYCGKHVCSTGIEADDEMSTVCLEVAMLMFGLTRRFVVRWPSFELVSWVTNCFCNTQTVMRNENCMGGWFISHDFVIPSVFGSAVLM